MRATNTAITITAECVSELFTCVKGYSGRAETPLQAYPAIYNIYSSLTG